MDFWIYNKRMVSQPESVLYLMTYKCCYSWSESGCFF